MLPSERRDMANKSGNSSFPTRWETLQCGCVQLWWREGDKAWISVRYRSSHPYALALRVGQHRIHVFIAAIPTFLPAAEGECIMLAIPRAHPLAAKRRPECAHGEPFITFSSPARYLRDELTKLINRHRLQRPMSHYPSAQDPETEGLFHGPKV